MAKRGPKSKSPDLHVVTGTHRPDRHGDPVPEEKGDQPNSHIVLQPFKKLSAPQQKVWDNMIATATWLEHHDASAAYSYVLLAASQVTHPKDFTAADHTQKRQYENELGFAYHRGNSKAARPEKKNPNDRFFND